MQETLRLKVLECSSLRAEVELARVKISAAHDEVDYQRARAEKAEVALRDCWAVMDASKDRRERELARKMRLAILHAPAPAEQPGKPELRRVMGMGIPIEEQIEEEP